MKTLLFVRTENNNAFDGSVKGTALKLNGPVTSTKVENQFQLSQGFLEQSNADLTSELINLVVAQQAFAYNTQTLQVENETLQATTALIQ